MARTLIPPHAYLYKQTEHNRWAVALDKHQRSRSWDMWGFNESLEACLKWVWKRSLERNGFEILDCPVQGLFPKRTWVPEEDEKLLEETYVIP